MARVTLLILLLTFSAWAEPLRVVETKRQTVGEEKDIRVEYAIEGGPFRMETMIEGSGGLVEVHYTNVYREGETDHRAAYSEIWYFREKRGTLAYVKGYRKFDDAPEAKGLGNIVLHSLFANKNVTHVRADLAYSNYAAMEKELAQRNLPATVETFNDVVMSHSHLGRVLAANGFGVVPEETAKDRLRPEISFRFARAECTSRFAGLLKLAALFRRRPQ